VLRVVTGKRTCSVAAWHFSTRSHTQTAASSPALASSSCRGWKSTRSTTPLWPLKLCVAKPPATSHTRTCERGSCECVEGEAGGSVMRTSLSALAVATRPPEASTAMSLIGALCGCAEG